MASVFWLRPLHSSGVLLRLASPIERGCPKMCFRFCSGAWLQIREAECSNITRVVGVALCSLGWDYSWTQLRTVFTWERKVGALGVRVGKFLTSMSVGKPWKSRATSPESLVFLQPAASLPSENTDGGEGWLEHLLFSPEGRTDW